MMYSAIFGSALFGVVRVALAQDPIVLSSFWVGQISGEQECGGGVPQDCNEGGTWALSSLTNFCDNVGVGSLFPAANGAQTDWCNVTGVSFSNVQNGDQVAMSNVGVGAIPQMCGQNGGFSGDYDGIYALLFDITTGPDYTDQIGTCYFDSTINGENCANVAGSLLYNSNVRCDVQQSTESKRVRRWEA